jgi:hypothetical protein
MPDNAVLQFKKIINSFSKVFNHLSLSCVAIKNEKKWVSMFTSLMLANSDDARVFAPQTIKVKSELVALFVTYPLNAFDALFDEMQSGSLSLKIGAKTERIYLNRVAAGLTSHSVSLAKLNFSHVWRPLRQYALAPEEYRPSIVLQTLGDRFYELLSQDDIGRISELLRKHKPPYNGLDGLLRFAETRHRPNSSSDQALVEIKAVLPFKIIAQEDQVFVECPKSVAPKLSILIFFSGHESKAARYSKQLPIAEASNCALVPFQIDWPSHVSQAEVHVLYDKNEIETVTIRHWASAANWRLAVDSYFDPETELLKEALSGDGQRLKSQNRSEAFEQAIVRLLTLGGVAVTWHGAIRQSGRPDLAGYCEIPGRRIALIGECTLEKPSAKLDALKSRLGAVRLLAGDSVEILPVVFTACDPIQVDYRSAAKEGIALVGKNEVAWLLELIERNAKLPEIIKQIENSRFVNDLPGIARWGE